MSEWWCAIGGERRGPVSEAQVRAMAADGRLARTDLVWNAAASRWDKANRVRGLFPPPAPAPARTPGEDPVTPESVAAGDVGPFLKLSERFSIRGGSWWQGWVFVSPRAFYLIKLDVAAGPGLGSELEMLLARALSRYDDVRSCRVSELPPQVVSELDPLGVCHAKDVIILPREAVSMVAASVWAGGVVVHCGRQKFVLVVERLALGGARAIVTEMGWAFGTAIVPTAPAIHGAGYRREGPGRNPMAPTLLIRIAYGVATVAGILLMYYFEHTRWGRI
jgi:hypothetical protein